MENGTNGPRRGIDKNTEQPFLKANTHKKKNGHWKFTLL